MSCTSCGASFSFLKKEHGCKMCGFAFCGKCCNIKVIVPTISEKKKQQICKGCSVKLNNKPSSVPNKLPSPPLAFQRHLQEDSSLKTVHTRAKEQSDLDKELAARLDKLKERPKAPIVSDQELRERLSKLKGIPPSPQSSSRNMSGPYVRANSTTETEQAEVLLRQVQQQVKLEVSSPNVDAELAVRLQKLREKSDAAQEAPLQKVPDAPVNKPANNTCESATAQADAITESTAYDTDEESEASKLVKQYMEEVNLNKRTGYDDNEAEEAEEDLNSKEKEEEFPWCIICTGDAEVRCIGCSMDLYCHQCHKECHDREDLHDHKIIPYEK